MKESGTALEFPEEIRNRINELAENADLKSLKESAARLSENYRAESSDGKRGAANEIDALAYSAVRMPATFAAVSKALELSLTCFGGEINSILDVGAGTGAGIVAAARLCDCKNVTCIEREINMLELGKNFCKCAGVPAAWEQRDLTDGLTDKADLTLCSYCLNELSEKQRESALSELVNSAKKLLVIVEPGTLFSFERMKQTRQFLLNNGLKIAAPCPSENACPLPEGDWCHFTARAQRTKLHKLLKNANVPYEDEKFCFIAAVREDCEPCQARILRRPIIESGRITLSLCGENGLKTELVTKKSPFYKAARKSDSGDEFPPRTR